MSLSLRRRIEKQAEATESRWLSAWDELVLEVVLHWRSVDPEARQHYELYLAPLEREWLALDTAEQEDAFIARGASWCERCGLPPELWAWFWRESFGRRLRGDLTAWPHNVSQPPEPFPSTPAAVIAVVSAIAAG